MKVGVTNATVDLQAVVHERPQAPSGDMIFWDIYTILNAVCIEAGKGGISKYVYTMWSSWEKLLESLGLEGVLRRSAFARAHQEDDDDNSRTVAFPNIGTTGLIVLLPKWSSAQSKTRCICCACRS